MAVGAARHLPAKGLIAWETAQDNTAIQGAEGRREESSRVHRWARTRFPNDLHLRVGKCVRIANRQGRRRLVRILEVRGHMVVVDTNHPWAGQALELELIGIQAPHAELRQL